MVPHEDSLLLARSAPDTAQYWEVADEHRLAVALQDGTIDAAIQLLLRP